MKKLLPVTPVFTFPAQAMGQLSNRPDAFAGVRKLPMGAFRGRHQRGSTGGEERITSNGSGFADGEKHAGNTSRVNTELFPEFANVWDSVGEGCLKAGKSKEALAAYENALRIAKKLRTAIDAVKTRKNNK